jgi:hypothetical protein
VSEAEPVSPAVVPKPRRRRSWRIALIVAGALLIWLGFDLYGPRKHSLREFDPQEVARLETAMWRSYYDQEKFKLFRELAELLRVQYGLPPVRSYSVAFDAARAAFLFKDGKGRPDYEKALPDLVKYYRQIHRVGDINFDVDHVARLELEWWIVHRERKAYGREALELALAELPAEIFLIQVSRTMEHARLRAEAMFIRDDRAEAGTVSEEDWRKIETLLRESWQSLWQAVQQARSSDA